MWQDRSKIKSSLATPAPTQDYNCDVFDNLNKTTQEFFVPRGTKNRKIEVVLHPETD
jgi:hypothetical protein